MENADDHKVSVQQRFVRHQGALRAYLLALCSDFSLADDVLQEVFLTVSARAAEFDPQTNFPAWARSIARFKFLEACRHRPGPTLDADAAASLAASCPDDWGSDTKLAALAKCLGTLAPKAQEIVRLRYLREHSPPEIAKLLSRTVNSIGVALTKARVALRECIERQLRHEAQA
jgi:RNA polymerase sigma-70 factor (ECF subfamily)